jgi:hypothetical protein
VKYLSWSLFFFINLLQANIFEIESIKQIKNWENNNTLVLFDIDHTLLQSIFSSKPRKMQYFSNLIDFCFNNKFTQFIIQKTIIPLLNKVYKLIPQKGVEEEMAKLIHRLQKENIPILALTKRKTSNNADVTARQLKKIGVDFSKSKLALKKVVLTPPASFAQGIIATAGTNKGTILDEFLKKTDSSFSKIILIDDKLKNLYDVDEALKKMNIDFTGIRYGYLDNKDQLSRFIEMLESPLCQV